MFLSQNNLFQPPAQGEPVQTVEEIPADTSSFDFSFLGGLDMTTAVSYVNMFVLAWCVFYSVLQVSNFFFYYVLYTEGGELSRENDGINSIKHAGIMWLSYLFCLIFVFLFITYPGLSFVFGPLSILLFILKMVFIDMPKLPVLQNISTFIINVIKDLSSKKDTPDPQNS